MVHEMRRVEHVLHGALRRREESCGLHERACTLHEESTRQNHRGERHAHPKNDRMRVVCVLSLVCVGQQKKSHTQRGSVNGTWSWYERREHAADNWRHTLSCVFVRRFASRGCWSGKKGCSFTSTSVRFELNSRRPVAASSAAVLVRPRGEDEGGRLFFRCVVTHAWPPLLLVCIAIAEWPAPQRHTRNSALCADSRSLRRPGLLAHVLKIWFLNLLPCSLTPLTKPRASREGRSAGATAVVGSIGRTPTANTTGLCLGA